jgi:hypothetical protein
MVVGYSEQECGVAPFKNGEKTVVNPRGKRLENGGHLQFQVKCRSKIIFEK